MAKSPASRYSSAHAFALALQRIQAELNLSVTPFEVLEEPHPEDSHPDDGFEETRVRSIAAIDPERTGSAPTFPARTRPQRPDSVPAASPRASPPALPPTGVPAAEPARPQVPGHLFTGQPPTGYPSAEWSHATMLRGSAPVAEYGSPQDSTVRRPAVPAATQRPPGQPAAGRNSPEPELDPTVSRPPVAPETAPDVAADHGKRNLWLAIAGGALLALAVVVGLVVANAAPRTPAPVETQQVDKPPADALDNGSVPIVEGLTAARDTKDPNIIVFSWTNPKPQDGDTYKYRTKSAKADGPYDTTTNEKAFISGFGEPPICLQVILVRADGNASPEDPDSIACLKE
jgi:hypothetical protein